MQGVQGYVWLKLITPTNIVPADHGFWKPRGGVLGFIAGWLVGPYAAAGPRAEDGRKNDARIPPSGGFFFFVPLSLWPSTTGCTPPPPPPLPPTEKNPISLTITQDTPL